MSPLDQSRTKLDGFLDWSTGALLGIVILLVGYLGGWGISSVIDRGRQEVTDRREMSPEDSRKVEAPERELIPVSGKRDGRF